MSNSLKSKLSFFIILFILIWAVFLYSVVRVIIKQTEPYQQPDSLAVQQPDSLAVREIDGRKYARYVPYCNSPYGYHRYQSNQCDPTQDKLPITLPDPNDGIPPISEDTLVMRMMFGNTPCGKLNYCQ